MAVQVSRRYVLADYWLEPDKQLLSRGGQPVHLAKRPLQVLLYLLEHRDRFVSRNELLDLFWEGKEVYDDALRKCIGAIRKALDDRSEEPRFIETRWGVGYRYIGPLEDEIIQEAMAVAGIEKARGVKIVVEEEEVHEETPVSEEAITHRCLPHPPACLQRHSVTRGP